MRSGEDAPGNGLRCATRLHKNLRHLRREYPEIGELPGEVLATAHLGAAGVETLAGVSFPEIVANVRGPLFAGTMHFIRLAATDATTGAVFSIADTDLRTVIEYAGRAAVPISDYCRQYGENRLSVSPNLVTYQVKVRNRTYSDDDVQRWVDDLAGINGWSTDACVAILNPPGLTPSTFVGKGGGYHSTSHSGIPYLTLWVTGSGWTVADEGAHYAGVLSHEIAETVVDPYSYSHNPEVCDNCGLHGCAALGPWFHVFDGGGSYLGSTQDWPPTFPYGFYIASIAAPRFVNECADLPVRACDYAPPSWVKHGLPAMAASGDRVVAVVTAPGDGGMHWTSWELGGAAAPWSWIDVAGGPVLTDTPPAVSFRTTESGTSLWLAVRNKDDGRVYETLQRPDGSFGGWVAIPGVQTNVAPAASDGNLARGAPMLVVLAAPPDEQTYINVYLADQPPVSPPPGYWQAFVPSPWTTRAPAVALVGDNADYLFLATINIESRILLTQGNPYTPDQISAVGPLGFESSLSPGMASANNRTAIVAADPDGAMFYDWWDLGGGPHGWTPLGSEVVTDAAPAIALVDGGEYFFVLARGADGGLYLNQADIGGPIVGWQHLG